MALKCQLRFCYACMWSLYSQVENDWKVNVNVSGARCLLPLRTKTVFWVKYFSHSLIASEWERTHKHTLVHILSQPKPAGHGGSRKRGAVGVKRWGFLHGAAAAAALLGPHVCFVCPCPLRDAGPDGPEEASPGGEAPRRCQSGGLHSHHCADCCEFTFKWGFTHKKTAQSNIN